jgi:hypothetical protein
MKHNQYKKKDPSGLRPQQHLIELADFLHPLLELLIILQPPLYLRSLLGPETDLLILSTWITDREHQYRVPFAALTFGATVLMSDGALQKGPPKNFGGGGQIRCQPIPLAEDLFVFHLFQ